MKVLNAIVEIENEFELPNRILKYCRENSARNLSFDIQGNDRSFFFISLENTYIYMYPGNIQRYVSVHSITNEDVTEIAMNLFEYLRIHVREYKVSEVGI